MEKFFRLFLLARFEIPSLLVLHTSSSSNSRERQCWVGGKIDMFMHEQADSLKMIFKPRNDLH
jgi:hypothetical protein